MNLTTSLVDYEFNHIPLYAQVREHSSVIPATLVLESKQTKFGTATAI